MNPLVSIIIPVYNKASFVEETLDSALRQSYPNIELVLVNDGSTDNSLEILESYQYKYPDKIVLINMRNSGVSKATNVGIKASKGEYIQFLDADDILSLDKIKNQILILQNKAPDLICTCQWLTFKKDISDSCKLPYEVFRNFCSGVDLQLRFWESQEMMAVSSYLTHRSIIEKVGPWDEFLTINQDGEFFLRVLLEVKSVLYESYGKVYYRQPGLTNVSQQKSELAFSSLLNSYRSYESHILNFEDTHRTRKALKKVYQKFIYDCYPNYPHLLKEAESCIKALNVTENTYVGGAKFQKVSKIIGFTNALLLKRAFKKIV